MMGLVLCGGMSSRMGSDKGLLQLENISWMERALKNCTALNLPTFISLRGNQLTSYAPLIDPVFCIQDNESLPYQGPLKGIMSAHQMYPSEDLFVLACDLPYMKESTLLTLVNMQVSNPNYQAYCYTNQGNMEPLVALYMASGLSRIQELGQKNALQKHSLKYVLSILNTFCQPIDPTDQSSFQNFNSPSDLFFQ